MKRFLRHFRSFCERAFYETNSKIFVVTNDAISVVIVISILAIILESVSGLSRYYRILTMVEYVAVLIFSVEYLCRIVGARRKLPYIFSFFGFIDLVSILPTWLNVSNLTPLKTVRVLRILRFLRIMRLTKVARLEHLERPSKEDTAAVIRLDLEIYFLTVLFTVVMLGSLVYVFEHGHPNFENIPVSMLWILESLLGGSITDTTPQTYAGIGIFMIARFISFILLGLLIHLIGSVISHFLLGREAKNSVGDQPPLP